MKVAAFNVENLFDRAKAFNKDHFANVNTTSSKIISAVADLNNLFNKPSYSANDKKAIIKLVKFLGLEKSDTGKFVILRKIRGRAIKRPRTNKPIEVVADGRGDWIGWVELKTEPVDEIAVLNTGQVIRDVNADVLAVIEAENRVLLEKFSEITLKKVNGQSYAEVMLIDGNDDRGIDVGIMCKDNYKIKNAQSHIYDKRPDGRLVYSRDCPEYEVITPNNKQIFILPNHFKSKFGGDNQASRDKRRAQAKRTAEIYNRLISDGHNNIIVLGDLNDTPDSEPLRPLLVDTNLRDVSENNLFDTGSFSGKGTYGLGNDSQKIDYMLVSPNLFSNITACGLFRKGAWPGKRPVRWETYPNITEKIHVASDHHVIWAEFNI